KMLWRTRLSIAVHVNVIEYHLCPPERHTDKDGPLENEGNSWLLEKGNKSMKRITVTLVLVLLGAISALAQAKPEADKKPAGPLPTVDQVLENYVKAIGGKEANMKVTSRVEKGTLEIAAMGVNAPIELYSKAPNKSLFFLDVPSFGVIQEGFDGTGAWSQEPQGG